MIRALWAALLLWPAAVLADGRTAFERGEGVSVLIGDRAQPAERLRMACAGCHGADGRGGREGGAAAAPPILWQVLSAPTAGRPGYDPASFAVALRDGRDPGGRRLQMPRFVMTPEVTVALQTYLADLDGDQRRGIDGLQIAIRLPDDAADRAAVLVAVGDFNLQGGSWGRQIAPGDPWFLDLGAALATLRPRLIAAEERLAEETLRARTGLTEAPRTASDGPLLLTAPEGAVFIGPPAEAVVWARRQGLPLDAARALVLTQAILQALRDAGPEVTRSGIGESLARLDLSALIAVQPLEP